MCGSSKTTTPDTSGAQAEQQRQYDASNALSQQQLDQQNAQFQKQFDAANSQYAAQLQAAQDEANRQAAQSKDALTQQQAQFESVQALTRQEDEAKTAAAQLDATNQRNYATGREHLADQYTGQINAQYAGFDDPYYKAFAQKLVDTYAPQVAQGYSDAARSTKATFNDAGTLDSSGAARSFAQLAAQKTTANAQLDSSAMDQANVLKGNINQQRGNALGALMGSLSTADPLPAGGDPTQALGGLSSRLSTTMSAIGTPQANYAPNYTPPSFSVATPKARGYYNSYASGLA